MERPKNKLAPVCPHITLATFLSTKNKFSLLLLLLLSLVAIFGTLMLGLHLDPQGCSTTAPAHQPVEFSQPSALAASEPFPSVRSGDPDAPEAEEENKEEEEFWKQPDGMGYRPCLKFSKKYIAESKAIVDGRSKYLMVVVSGGLNQQRSQTIDAVVIARILGAALVVPVFNVDMVWEDESEFSDIFDLEHFKRVLADDVRVVSSLPPEFLRVTPAQETKTPFHATAGWIRSRYLKQINKHRVLLIRAFDSRLSKDLPGDLLRLRCKVGFDALRFAPKILELGNRLAARMRSEGPYLALHLRVEKDVWVRTGCLPGLTPEHDRIIEEERQSRPDLLTARSRMLYNDRKLAGHCPLTVGEVARLLKALGCPRYARIYWAGGEPFGGEAALEPLTREFPFLYNKENVSLPGELEPFANRSSILAAIDYIVAESSDVFMPSHGGNMGRAIQGHRAYNGHKKYITPKKRDMLRYFLDTSLDESEFTRIVKDLHNSSFGEPHSRLAGKDVMAHPIPACMCNTTISWNQSSLEL